ncbi:hypothetical protein [Rhodopirellula bahusiensis]|uniref:Uncharacterized protein n=1 Tax=Rhodopirellula bahusiensis TaxID=2014065 RepID=A0A2G1W7Y7_9BACT|nr:hypothetical protein [Rhodopirellula bahusiensis]PHQ35136.1 hypothetical protein CEE69_12010 [Rhodopirellula bahusiensis]
MTVLETFRDVLKQRMQAFLWRSVASDVEADTILQDVANLERLEQQAKRYEAEGNPNLAALLRQRAAMMSMDAPGGSITQALESVGGAASSTGLLADGRDDKEKPEETAVKPATRRRSRKRPSDQASCGE